MRTAHLKFTHTHAHIHTRRTISSKRFPKREMNRKTFDIMSLTFDLVPMGRFYLFSCELLFVNTHTQAERHYLCGK